MKRASEAWVWIRSSARFTSGERAVREEQPADSNCIISE